MCSTRHSLVINRNEKWRVSFTATASRWSCMLLYAAIYILLLIHPYCCWYIYWNERHHCVPFNSASFFHFRPETKFTAVCRGSRQPICQPVLFDFHHCSLFTLHCFGLCLLDVYFVVDRTGGYSQICMRILAIYFQFFSWTSHKCGYVVWSCSMHMHMQCIPTKCELRECTVRILYICIMYMHLIVPCR